MFGKSRLSHSFSSACAIQYFIERVTKSTFQEDRMSGNRRFIRCLIVLFTFGLSACRPADDQASVEPAGDSAAASSAMQADTLPSAIVGKARPPQGTTASYFPADPATRGYLAVPTTPGPHAAVILVHEWDGLNDRVRQVADAMAAEGYVALAADLYSGKLGSSTQENTALMEAANKNPSRMIENLNAAAKFLRDGPEVTGKIAVMGWCFGGGVALNYGIEGEQHDATAIFYGRLVTDPARLAKLRHPVYGTFGGKDQGIPVAQVNEFATALRNAGVKNDIHVYDEMEHGFWLWVDKGDARAGPALDAWKRLRAFLNSSLR
jgi:carboxymethylenebutenolidase